jgi:hypothetical protein
VPDAFRTVERGRDSVRSIPSRYEPYRVPRADVFRSVQWGDWYGLSNDLTAGPSTALFLVLGRYRDGTALRFTGVGCDPHAGAGSANSGRAVAFPSAWSGK